MKAWLVQCAYCRRVKNNACEFVDLDIDYPIKHASHGICPDCLDDEMAKLMDADLASFAD